MVQETDASRINNSIDVWIAEFKQRTEALHWTFLLVLIFLPPRTYRLLPRPCLHLLPAMEVGDTGWVHNEQIFGVVVKGDVLSLVLRDRYKVHICCAPSLYEDSLFVVIIIIVKICKTSIIQVLGAVIQPCTSLIEHEELPTSQPRQHYLLKCSCLRFTRVGNVLQKSVCITDVNMWFHWELRGGQWWQPIMPKYRQTH